MAKTVSRLAVLGLVILVSLVYRPLEAKTADPVEPLRWSRLAIPAQGAAGGWVLASGADVPLLTLASDGTLYAYGKGLGQTLLKSTDGGYRWQPVGQVSDIIVAMAITPGDARRVYYATSSRVFRSTDGGDSFAQLPPSPGAGSGNVEITSLAIGGANPFTLVVATRDTDGGQYGGVYTLDDSLPVVWTDTGLSGYDVYAVAFSPYFPENRELVAVATDETSTLVTTRAGDAAWGTNIADARLDKGNSRLPTAVAVANSAAIAFPEDGNNGEIFGLSPLFVAINAGGDQGDVYRIDRAMVTGTSDTTDLNLVTGYGQANLDVTSLAVSGYADRASLLAGAANSAQVYFSRDGGRTWRRSNRAPTGQQATRVVMAADFSGSRQAYAATSGAESAVSRTVDGGLTWNQTGLIDTAVASIVDLGASAGYQDDGTAFLLTWGGEHSLWRRDVAARWERIFSSALPGVDSLGGVRLAPAYGQSSRTVFVAGTSSGSGATWRAKDGGQNFESARLTIDPTTGSGFPIDAWAVTGDDTLLIAGLNGTSKFYRSTDGGWSYRPGTVVGTHQVKSIAVSPGYPGDPTILVGSAAGWVYISRDDGRTFQPLPDDAASAPLAGSLSVAFAPSFERSGTVYAASSSLDKGIYRLVIGRDSRWQSIDGTLPLSSSLSKICLSAEGVLYAGNLKAGGGLERSLAPDYSLGPAFETVTRGLENNAKLDGLWLAGGRLWSVDTANKWVVFYRDTMTTAVVLTTPDDGAPGLGTLLNYQISNLSLDWATLEGASEYRWQIDADTDFSSVPDGFESTTRATQVRLPRLEPATRYHWRVRATSPVLSPWSEKRSFTTSLGSNYAAPRLVSPAAGDQQVMSRPVFQWDEVAGSSSYELMVSDEVAFARPTLLKAGEAAIASTAWQTDLELAPGVTYYWRVRAVGEGTNSAWSATRAFTTAPALPQPVPVIAPPPAPAQPVSPLSPAETANRLPSGLDGLVTEREPVPPPLLPAQADVPYWARWFLYFGGALLLIAAAGLVTLIILTWKISRLGHFWR
ncbi:MAG: hypothetical protein V1823_00840 [Chloroflexota bacterium]